MRKRFCVLRATNLKTYGVLLSVFLEVADRKQRKRFRVLRTTKSLSYEEILSVFLVFKKIKENAFVYFGRQTSKRTQYF